MSRNDVSGWMKRNGKRQAYGCGLQRVRGEVGSEHTCRELQTRTEDKWLDILASSWSTGWDCPYQTGAVFERLSPLTNSTLTSYRLFCSYSILADGLGKGIKRQGDYEHRESTMCEYLRASMEYFKCNLKLFSFYTNSSVWIYGAMNT